MQLKGVMETMYNAGSFLLAIMNLYIGFLAV